MASGRPFIASIDESSEVARLAKEFQCGLVIQPNDPAKLEETLRWAYRFRSELEEMGARGRKAAELFYSKEVAVSKYESIFAAALNAA